MNIRWLKRIGFSIALLTSLTAKAEMNLTFKPIELLIGSLNAKLDIPLNSNWVIGPQLTLLNLTIGDATIAATSLGVDFGYYFSGNFQDSGYVTPGISYGSFSVENSNDEVSVSGASLSVVGGYHWFWETFNLRLGAGTSFFTGNASVSLEDENGDEQDISLSTGLIIDFALGFKF